VAEWGKSARARGCGDIARVRRRRLSRKAPAKHREVPTLIGRGPKSSSNSPVYKALLAFQRSRNAGCHGTARLIRQSMPYVRAGNVPQTGFHCVCGNRAIKFLFC